MAGGWTRDGAVHEQIEASIDDELKRMRSGRAPVGESWTHCAECEEPMLEAKEGFRRINAYRQLPVLDAALKAHQGIHAGNTDIDRTRSHAQFGPGGGDGDVVALLPAVQKQPCISGSTHA